MIIVKLLRVILVFALAFGPSAYAAGPGATATPFSEELVVYGVDTSFRSAVSARVESLNRKQKCELARQFAERLRPSIRIAAVRLSARG